MATSNKSSTFDLFTERLSERQQLWTIRVIALVVVLLLWEVVGQILGNIFFAPLSQVAPAYVALLQDGGMISAIVITFREMLIGFLLAVVVAIPIGLLMGRSQVIDQALSPWVSAMFVTATASLLPLFVILFGIGFNFRLVIVFLSCIWFILLNTYHGAEGVDEEYADVGRSFDASEYGRFRDIVLPATLPYIFAGLRMGLIHALRGVILAQTFIEFGYGGLIAEYSRQSVDTAPILGLIVTLVIVGYGLRVVLEKLESYLFPWTDETEAMGSL